MQVHDAGRLPDLKSDKAKAYVFVDTVLREEDAYSVSDLLFQLQLLRTQHTSGQVHYSVLPPTP